MKKIAIWVLITVLFVIVNMGLDYLFNPFDNCAAHAKTKITNRKLAVRYCKRHYPKCKIKFVKLGSNKVLNRKGKKIVYVERIVSRSKGNYGLTIKGKYYIKYNKWVKKGKKVVSYCIWNPHTNYIDDVVAVVDNKRIR